MFDLIHEESLPPAEAAQWLRHVVTDELARIKRSRATIFADGGADGGADWAMAEAWRILAQRGPNAALTDNDRTSLSAAGRSYADLERLNLTIGMLSDDLRSDAHTNRMTRSYRSLIGRAEDPGATIILALRKLLIEGRAAAWAKSPADQGIDIASEIAMSMAAKMVTDERQAFLEVTEEAPISMADPELVVASAPPSTPPSPVFAPPVATDEPVYDPAISAVIERLVMQKSIAGTSSVTQRQYQSFGALFTQITGLSDVRLVKKSHCARFREVLQIMPKSWGKSPKDAGSTLEEMLAKARGLPPEKVGLSPGTVNRHLDHLSQMLEQASDDGIAIDEKVNPKRLRVPEEQRDRDKRSSFRRAELEKLFEHTIWRGCKSEKLRNHPGDLTITDGLYWVPILAAYTGARREELAALTVDDIQCEGGIHFLAIEENENRGVKNFSSVRRVPLHDRVIELGFLRHIEKYRKRGGDIFPELRPEGYTKEDRRKKYGDRLYYAFAKSLEITFDGNPRELCLHSMRHYARDQLALDTTIPDKVRYDLIGHEMDDVDSKTYGEASPLDALQVAVNKLPVVI